MEAVVYHAYCAQWRNKHPGDGFKNALTVIRHRVPPSSLLLVKIACNVVMLEMCNGSVNDANQTPYKTPTRKHNQHAKKSKVTL